MRALLPSKMTKSVIPAACKATAAPKPAIPAPTIRTRQDFMGKDGPRIMFVGGVVLKQRSTRVKWNLIIHCFIEQNF